MSNGQDKTRRMRLWDAPVRLFHWALVITIAVAWWSNQQANIQVHEIAGYTALSLVLFRVIWGVVGRIVPGIGQFLFRSFGQFFKVSHHRVRPADKG